MSLTTDYSSYVRHSDDGAEMMDFAVDNMTCAACILKVERAVKNVSGVENARVNYTNRRLHIEWTRGKLNPAIFVTELNRIGYDLHPFSAASAETDEARHMRWLLRCLAVAFFGAMNIMLLSVSIWAGDATQMTPETRDMFHWLSALIALPVVAFAGQPFFISAYRALKARSLNMDVPISVGVLLALVMSVYETAHHAIHAYFDSGVMLLTFLLLGRTLDHMMRRKTREIAGNLASLRVPLATRQSPDGTLTAVPSGALVANDIVVVRPGERIPADGVLLNGSSDLDESLVTGETQRRNVTVGDEIYAGAMNYSGQIIMKVSASGDNTLLGEVERLMEHAMTSKAKTMRLADRVARSYAPFVHLAALCTALGWYFWGASAHDAIIAAIAVLIITCPCALALAVPAVQVAASGALFKVGLLLNAGDALERLAVVDTIVFDKTGTLTLPIPEVVNRADVPDDLFEIAARLAQSSNHPLAKALARQMKQAVPFEDATETTGQGVSATVGGQRVLLGSASFCDAELEAGRARLADPQASVLCVRAGERVAVMLMRQALRHDAVEAVAALKGMGYKISILSGDRAETVETIAAALGVTNWRGGLKPADKTKVLSDLAHHGHKVLMIGDGINDAPAIAAAHASISPISAAELTQSCADAVFLGGDLEPVYAGLQISRRARTLMMQNLALSVIYNIIALPLAVMGYVTPLIAALAMSGSSILVTLNAVRAQGAVRLPHARSGEQQ